MQRITVKQLLNLLPIEDKLRQDVLAEFDSYSDGQRLSLSKLCWMMFYELIDAEAQYEFKKALVDIKDGKRKLSEDLYQQIEKQVSMKFMRNIRDEQEADLLEETRNKLKTMITEKLANKINSSPLHQKP